MLAAPREYFFSPEPCPAHMGVLEIEAPLVWTEGLEVIGTESRETRKGSVLNRRRRACELLFLVCPLGTNYKQGLSPEWDGLISQSGRQTRERSAGQGPGATGGNEVEGGVGWTSGLCKDPGAWAG